MNVFYAVAGMTTPCWHKRREIGGMYVLVNSRPCAENMLFIALAVATSLAARNQAYTWDG